MRRGAAILWLLAGHPGPLSLSQIARAVGILPSTCLHILREMVAARLIGFDAVQKTYRLGQGLVALGQAALRYDPFADAAQPHLQAIAARHDVTATAMSIVDDEHMSVVAFANPPTAMSLKISLGMQVPTLAGAAGRCLAAFGTRPPSQLQRAFARVRWQVPIAFEAWLREVEQAKRKGYAMDLGIHARGVTTIATPVFAHGGKVTRTIGIGAITDQLDRRQRDRLIADLKQAAREIGARLE